MFAKQSSSPIHSGVAFHIVRFIPLNFSSRVVLCVFSSSSPTVMTMTRAAAKRSSVPDTVKNPHSLKLSSSRKKQKVPANTRKGQAKGSKDMTSTPCEEGDRPVEEQVINENRVQEVLQSGIKHVSQNPTTTPCNEKSDSASRGRSYFLVKSEPETRMQDGHDMKFSIDDLGDEPNATACWDGVRNYEARNIMREMREGDRAFFYHSNSRRTLPAIVGEVEIVREAYPDHTAFDKSDPHYDPKSNPDDPRWFMVDVRLLRKFTNPVSLVDIKAHEKLSNMQLVKRGRISVQRVTSDEWPIIMDMAGEAL